MDRLLEIINIVKSNNNQELIKSISDNLHLQNDLGFDSLGLAELTVRLENEYDIDIYENELVFTVGDVRKKLNL